MPVRPENRDRYPANWKTEIVPRIAERSGGRCECTGECGWARCPTRVFNVNRCTAINNEPSPVTGSRVVLTTAHLVSAVHLPMDLRVARVTYADKVVELIGTLVPVQTEGFERDNVVHDRALAEFIAGPSTSSARFVVALPSRRHRR
jgi:hypothetical protein